MAARDARAQAASPSFVGAPSAHHTQVKLLLSADSAKPGDTIWAGVDMKMEPGWHTYWKNPGAAGMATAIKWQLPPGISAGEIQWPLPKKFPPAEVTTYGYTNEVMLLVPLTIQTNVPFGQVDLKATVSWLECKDVCIPANQDVEVTLNIGNETKASADAAAIESWQKKVPKPFDLSLTAWWEKPIADDTRPLIINFPTSLISVQVDSADFFPDAYNQFEVQAATEMTHAHGEIRLRKIVKKYSGNWPKEISGVFLYHAPGYGTNAFAVKFSIADHAPAGETFAPAQTPLLALKPQPLWLMLLYAFIGGLILNIMPCVLPVIAIKILGFVSEARSEPRRVRNLGLIYALGVLVSFLVLAGTVIGVKAAGHRAGWGMQFGSPVFIVCLTTLVTLVALNLFGVYEISPGGRALSAAGELASKPGAPGAFFNGILATALATPCTAPILATALGFAFLQNNPAIIISIFLSAGLGLAAPYVLLSCNPALLKFLPKPGAWMQKFKVAMGFPMLATAVWLFNLAYDDYGKNVLWLGVFLVMVAFAAWIYGEFAQRGRHKIAAAIVGLLLLGGGYAFALEKELDWREALPQTNAMGSSQESPDGIAWQPWSREAVAQARAAGHPVLVDFTADWCLTCQVNKKIAIEIPSVEKRLDEINAVELVGDYTHLPDNITRELNRYDRAGVPLVLVYPKNPDAQPIVLPQVLTPRIVLDALDRAAR